MLLDLARTPPLPRRRGVARGHALRAVGLLAALVCVALAWRATGPAAARELRTLSPGAIGVAAGALAVATLLTCSAWTRTLAGYGHRLPSAAAARVFLLGQLARYLPGSVWSVGAHAALAAPYGVRAAASAGTSLLLLVLNLVCTLGLTLAGGLAGLPVPRPPAAVALVGVALCGLVLLPRVSGALGRLTSGGAHPRLAAPDTAGVLLRLGGAWASTGLAIAVLLPGAEGAAPGAALDAALGRAAQAAVVAALAYAVGLAAVLAPAGLGAREVTLVALLAPTVGLGPATAVAVTSRVLQTATDVGLAAAALLLTRAPEPGDTGP